MVDALLARLHPPLVSFPFVLLVLVVVLELIFYRRQDLVSHRMILGILSGALVMAILAYFSGHEASEEANQTFKIADEVIGRHFLFAKIFLFTLIPCVLFKYISLIAEFNKGFFKAVYLFLLCAALGLVIFTGKLGGDLVFIHGAGVKANLPVSE